MQKKILITFAIVAAIAIPIGNYTISPLFISATVNEPLPATTGVPVGKPLSGTFMGVHDGLGTSPFSMNRSLYFTCGSSFPEKSISPSHE
jgi:hypothetical protein